MKIRLLLLLAVLVNLSCEKSDRVTTSGRSILLNGKPYVIKGVCYHPVPPGSNERNFSNLTEDLALMKEAGINTIRVYSPILEEEVLNKLAASDIKVIIGFGYNQGGKFDILSGTFIDYVNKFKNHKAILFWELGNEYNYHPEWFGGEILNWYTALNNAAAMIHQNDLSRPVSTAHGELPDKKTVSLCPNIDIWGMNIYRWDNPGNLFTDWSKISELPMYLAEAGADSYMSATMNGYEFGPNEKAQADATKNILDQIFRNQEICSGVTLFAFSDEWWKAGNNDTQDPGGWAPNSSGVLLLSPPGKRSYALFSYIDISPEGVNISVATWAYIPVQKSIHKIKINRI